jgi:hypothetical protein
MSTDQLPGEANQAAARRERRWRWGAIGIVAIAGLLGMSLIGLFMHLNRLLWLVEGACVVVIVLLTASTQALIHWRRRRGSRALSRSPLWEVGFQERNRIVKAIRRDRPVPPEQQDLALRTARHIVERGRWPIWLFTVAGALVVTAGVLNSGLGRIVDIIVGCLFFYLAGDCVRMLTRARTYLRRDAPDA